MSWIDGMRHVARTLVRRGSEERDLDDEVAFHLEMEAAKLVREGHPPDEARRLARLRFGGVDRMKERARDERGARWLEDFVADLRYGARGLMRSRSFTVTAVLTLTVGIGATTAVFSLVDGILLRPLPYREADRLVELRELGEGRRFFPSYPNFDDWRARARSFDGVISIQPPGGEQPLLDAGDPMVARVLGVSRDFLSVLGVAAFLGRDFTADENAVGGGDVAIVSHAFWASRLGANPDLPSLGFTVFGSRYQVVGVLPPGFRLMYDADVYYPLERWPGTTRSSHAYRVLARLADGVTLADAKAEMDGIAAAIQEKYPGQSQAETVGLTPLPEVVLGAQQRPLTLLMLAGALVLLVACGNVASTLLARGASRLQEFAVRASLGAGRGRLVRQVLAESLVLTALGGVGGTLLALGAVRLAAAFGPDSMPRIGEVTVGVRSIALAAGLSVATAFAFGLYPALRLARTSRIDSLRTHGVAGRKGAAWSVMLAGEAAFAVVLLVAASLLVRSVRTIVDQDAGWRVDGVLEASVTIPSGVFDSEDEAIGFMRRLEADLDAIPGVDTVGIGNYLPLDAGYTTAPAREAGTEMRLDNYTGWRLVDRGYFRSLGITLLQGRLIGPGDDHHGVINESLAKVLWPDGESPIGKYVLSNYDAQGEPIEVVGVVADARDWRWREGSQPELYVPWWAYASQLRGPVRYLLSTPGDPGRLIPVVRERLRALNARVPADYVTLSDALSASAGDRRFVSAILSVFAAAGLFLGLVGVFGVVAYSVAQRRREIGIRMALGAAGPRVRAEVRSGALRAVGVGALVGAGLSVALSGFVEALLYEVPARDPVTLAGVLVLFLATAALAGDLPARASTRVDPTAVLRE